MIDNKDLYRIPMGFKQSSFAGIKETLAKQAKTFSNLKDYDFEGSTVNSFLGLQANALLKHEVLSNIAIMENNIYTARDRRSIVMHAQQNGYIPSGVTASRITVALQCSTKNLDPSIKIPRGTKFQGRQTEDGKTYRFVTTKDVNSIRGEGGLYFPVVNMVQGRIMRIETRFSGDTPLLIREKNIDREQIRVWIDGSEWQNWTYKNIVDATGGSTIFYVRETFDGDTEIRFGVGVVTYSKAGNYRENNYIGGLTPIEGSRIVIEYLRTEGSEANGCTIFTYNDVIRGVNVDMINVNYNNDPNFIGSYGGGDIEDKESIRENGIMAGETQRRAVTDSDWKTILDRKYAPIIQARQIFNPPGAPDIVAIAIKPKGALNLTTDQTREIKDYLSNYHMGRFEVSILKPTYVFLDHDISIRYSSNELMESKDWLEEKVTQSITDFYKMNVEFFNTPLHKSKLTTAINDTHPSIKGSSVNLRLVREEESFFQTSYLGIKFYNRTEQGSFKSNRITFIRNPSNDDSVLELENEIFIQSAKRSGNTSVIVAGPFIKGDIDSKYKVYRGNDIVREEMETIDGIPQTEYYEIGTVIHDTDTYEWSFGSIGLTTDHFIDPYIEVVATPVDDDYVEVGVGALLIYEHSLRPQYTKFKWNISR